MIVKPQSTFKEQTQNAENYKQHNQKMLELENMYPKNAKVNERLKMLIDPNSFFLELSRHAGHELYDFPTPGAGILTGIGQVAGRACMILINNPELKAGCYYPATIEKTIRALKIAQSYRLPCLHLVDSGGAFLPMQADLFASENGFGSIFYEQAKLSALGILQYAVILRPCTAGGAYIPVMADSCAMVKDQAALFLAGPALVNAATGEKLDTQSLGGSKVHCHQSGVVQQEVMSEIEAINWLRSKISLIKDKHIIEKVSETDLDITKFIPSDPRFLPDINGILSALLDSSEFDEYQASIASNIRVGFGSINSHNVGIVANDGIMDSSSMIKANNFLIECNNIGLPVIFLHNTHGMMVGSHAEKSGIARHGANLIKTITNLRVKKITIMIGNSYGAGNYAMSGRAFRPDFLFQWPNNKIAIMGPSQQEFVLRSLDKESKVDTYSHSAIYHSARLRDDGIIMPNDTRKILSFILNIGAKSDRV